MTPDNQRALQTSNLAIIRAAAAELPRIGVAEAGAMLLVIARVAPDNYDRAALRWLVKLCQERSAVELDDIVRAATALALLREQPQAARPVLAEVCGRAG
jgi:hypothetical protein